MIILTRASSIANNYLAELRDREIQNDRMRFRKNLERLGGIMAYEISTQLTFEDKQVVTPLGKSIIPVLREQPVLIAILRAGIPFFQGFADVFDGADAGFIGASRVERGEDIKINLTYVASSSLTGKTVILIDPMLATGKSAVDAIHALLQNGKPAHIHIASLVAAPEGVEYVKQNARFDYTLWTFAVDEKLDHNFYIVPGLGDAGDLSYGNKL